MGKIIFYTIFVLFCKWGYSCKTTWETCKINSDCCEDHHCKDLDGEGNGRCIAGNTNNFFLQILVLIKIRKILLKAAIKPNYKLASYEISFYSPLGR